MRIIEPPSGWHSWLRIVGDVTPDDLERYLTPAEKADVGRLKVPERRSERTASRIAGKILLTDLIDDASPDDVEFAKENDRPFAKLRGSAITVSVSFTHSHGLGAAAAAELPIGIDLEKVREIRPQTTRFFLTETELAAAQSIDVPHRLLHFWSAKEAAFKMRAVYPTLLRTPLRVLQATSSGLTFRIGDSEDIVETSVIEAGFILGLARASAR
jgi:4'-phosphopantetheinyl transferase EntD